jgi:hypothetical protein
MLLHTVLKGRVSMARQGQVPKGEVDWTFFAGVSCSSMWDFAFFAF